MTIPAFHVEAKLHAFRKHRFGPAPRDPLERLWESSMPIPFSGCFVYLKRLDKDGYGIITIAGKNRKAHRVAYELLVGPIPDEMPLDHLCRVKSCWNSHHLEPVPSRVNTMRGNTLARLNAEKTHCPQGHAYDLVNTAFRNNRRICRMCERAKVRRHRLKRQAGVA